MLKSINAKHLFGYVRLHLDVLAEIRNRHDHSIAGQLNAELEGFQNLFHLFAGHIDADALTDAAHRGFNDLGRRGGRINVHRVFDDVARVQQFDSWQARSIASRAVAGRRLFKATGCLGAQAQRTRGYADIGVFERGGLEHDRLRTFYDFGTLRRP